MSNDTTPIVFIHARHSEISDKLRRAGVAVREILPFRCSEYEDRPELLDRQDDSTSTQRVVFPDSDPVFRCKPQFLDEELFLSEDDAVFAMKGFQQRSPPQ